MRPRPPHSPPLGFLVVIGAVVFVLMAFVIYAKDGEPGVSGSVVLTWNAALLDAVRGETTPPPLAARNLAIAHLALLDACDHAAGTGHARLEVLLAATGCDVASSLCPGRRGEFERTRDAILAGLKTPPTPDEWSVALHCASTALHARADDGANRSVTYIPSAVPGQWRRTPPFFRPPELPQWVAVRPFVVGNAIDLGLFAPPSLESSKWNAGIDEIRRLGGRDSTERTVDQTLSARFWSDFSFTNTPPGHWNEIAASVSRERGLDERANARLFAELNVALADAAIVCWRVKYAHNFWRPVTVLGADGWMPMLTTPPHPEYPSGHSVFSGAAAEVLASFFGSDVCEFSVHSDSVAGVERVFHSFSGAAREISLSRVYGGIHYRFSCEEGVELGRRVGREVMQRGRSGMVSTGTAGAATR